LVVADRGTDVAVAAAAAVVVHVGDDRGEAIRGVVGHPCCSDTAIACMLCYVSTRSCNLLKGPEPLHKINYIRIRIYAATTKLRGPFHLTCTSIK